jgi:hypothetical protein
MPAGQAGLVFAPVTALALAGMYLSWIRSQKWKVLLTGIVALLVISPVAQIYDDQDDVISPLMAVLLLAVTLGASRRKFTLAAIGGLIGLWLVISLLTEGSGLFAGKSLVAPLLFLVLLAIILVLLVRWLIGAVVIDAEILCAAVCGYLLIGLLWTGFDALTVILDPKAFATGDHVPVAVGDLLYFSYSTLTTVGFGDITPKNPFVRMVTILEAVVGTFYNTILIARFVGLYGFRARDAQRAHD